MKISIIVPILNESKGIQKLTAMLEELEGEKEVIFVDGGSVDGTRELILPAYTVISSEPGRGKQMNKGAEHAGGDVLLFLHCDSVLEKGALKSVEEAMAAGCKSGCFTMKFDSNKWLLLLIAYLSNLRVRLAGIVFGDQGMFIRKDIFMGMGGFADIPIMEDLEFSGRLRRSIKPKQLENVIVTSARRFEKNGVMRTIFFMHKMKILYWMGKNPEDLNRIYRNVR